MNYTLQTPIVSCYTDDFIITNENGSNRNEFVCRKVLKLIFVRKAHQIYFNKPVRLGLDTGAVTSAFKD